MISPSRDSEQLALVSLWQDDSASKTLKSMLEEAESLFAYRLEKIKIVF